MTQTSHKLECGDPYKFFSNSLYGWEYSIIYKQFTRNRRQDVIGQYRLIHSYERGCMSVQEMKALKLQDSDQRIISNKEKLLFYSIKYVNIY